MKSHSSTSWTETKASISASGGQLANSSNSQSIAMVIVIGLPMSIGISLLAEEVYYIFYGYSEYGAIISTIIGNSLALFISLKRLKKDMKFKYKDLLTILKKSIVPLLSMSVIVFILERLITQFFTSRITSIITCIICALVGAIVYGVLAYKNNLLYESLGKEYVDEILTKLRLKKNN